MCTPTVYYTRQNYGAATEKLAFECNKSVSRAIANDLHQQNPCMTIEIIFVPIPYCTCNYLLYKEFLTVCAYP